MTGIIIGKTHEQNTPRMGFSIHKNSGNTGAYPEQWIRYSGEAPVLTIAPTGTGKGVSTVIPAALTHDGPIVVVDPKGEICAVTAAERLRRGDRVVILAPFGLAGGMVPAFLQQYEASFNPLDVVRDAGDGAVDEAMTLASALIPDQGRNHDPFWEQSARNLISGTILWLACTAPDGQAHLGTLRRCLSSGDKTLAQMAAAMACCREHDGVIAEVAGMLSSTPDKTRGSILSTANNHLAFLRSHGGVRSLATSTFSSRDVIEGAPMAIYLVLPADKVESHSAYLRLWLTALVNMIARRRRASAKPTLFIIDEWANLGPLPAFDKISFVLRSFGVRSIFCLQAAAQLQTMYRNWEAFIHNAGVLQIFGSQNYSAARTVLDLTGISPVGLSRNEQILAIEGQPAFISERISYLSEPFLRSRATPNPYYAADAR